MKLKWIIIKDNKSIKLSSNFSYQEECPFNLYSILKTKLVPSIYVTKQKNNNLKISILALNNTNINNTSVLLKYKNKKLTSFINKNTDFAYTHTLKFQWQKMTIFLFVS